jgi:hypothetical protein
VPPIQVTKRIVPAGTFLKNALKSAGNTIAAKKRTAMMIMRVSIGVRGPG